MAEQVAQLEYIFNHVILPPKLPDATESSELIQEAEARLMSTFVTCLKNFGPQLSDSIHQECEWIHLLKMLDILQTLQCQAAIDQAYLRQKLDEMKPKDVTILPLRSQNSVMIFRRASKAVKCEVFENSPQHQAVLACQGALRRSFPAHAVEIPCSVFCNAGFLNAFVSKLAECDSHTVDKLIQRVAYPGSRGVKDTASPVLVTDMLVAILAANGQKAPVQRITKRIRDDVLCNPMSEPWRRSSWLTLRVGLQTTLIEMYEDGQSIYKNLMLFMIAQVVDDARRQAALQDLCHAGVMKIGRRAKKLGNDMMPFVATRVEAVCDHTRKALSNNWKQICQEDGNRPYMMEVRSFKKDTELALSNLKEALDDSLNHDTEMEDLQADFLPDCPNWLPYEDDLPSLELISDLQGEKCFALCEFEAWVLNDLGAWIEIKLLTDEGSSQRTNKRLAKYCESLARLVDIYHDESRISEQEPGLPRSTIIFTIALLWLALDKLTTTIEPSLADYSTEMPADLFTPLLLPQRLQMLRLHELEMHLSQREQHALEDHSLFEPPGSSHCYSNKIYQHYSSKYNRLKGLIVTKAQAAKEQHEEQYNNKCSNFHQKKQLAKTLSCEREGSVENYEHSTETCSKCKLNAEADALKVDVFEWPLPADRRLRAAILVELDYLVHLAAWRNVTWLLRYHISTLNPAGGASFTCSLSSYTGLIDFYKATGSRLTLATQAGSSLKSQQLHFPVELAQCETVNERDFQMYDRVTKCWVSVRSSEPDTAQHCTPILPDGSYKALQYALESTNHSQNRVIAAQEHCPTILNVHDFRRFGFLRADGPRIQWLNMLRELRAHCVDLNAPEVVTLFRQAALQAGPSNESTLREAHWVFRDTDFCREFLVELQMLLEMVGENWKRANLIHLICLLLQRIMTLTDDEEVLAQALTLLLKVRQITYDWLTKLSNLQSQMSRPEDANAVSNALLKSSLLCKMTFGVGVRVFSVNLSPTSTFVHGLVLVSDSVRTDLLSLTRQTWLFARFGDKINAFLNNACHKLLRTSKHALIVD